MTEELPDTRRASRLGWLGALALTAVLAALILAAQPIGTPWWTYADADGTYTASSLNIARGTRTVYLDHPGLPLQELLALTFRVYTLGQQLATGDPAEEHVDAMLLDLDRTRWAFRGLAVLFYLGGALLTALLCGRLFGHWYWAAVGGALWIGATNLVHMSIQYRPDVPLAALTLLVGFLIARAFERRRVTSYLAAAFALGAVLTVKIHAVALLPSLAVALAFRPPPSGWADRALDDIRSAASNRRHPLGALAVTWILVAGLLAPARGANDAALYLIAPVLALAFAALALVAARSRLGRERPRLGLSAPLAAALAVGMLTTLSLLPGVALDTVRHMARNVSGQGVNEGVDPFAELDRLTSVHMRPTLVLIALACVAAAVGIARRDAWPALWTVACLASALLAAARDTTPHYFAPAYMLAIPAVFWLAAAGRTVWLRAAVIPLAVWICVVQLRYRDVTAESVAAFRSVAEPVLAQGRRHLAPGEVALTPLNFPSADARYFNEVHAYIVDPPRRHYEFLPISAAAYEYAVSRGLRPRFYVTSPPELTNWLGPTTADLPGRSSVRLVSAGRFRITQVNTTTYAIVRQGP